MSKRVLIVEDDQYIREMYALVLKKAGYEVVETPDGAAGLTEAQQGGFDVILLDLMMPNMSGLEFLQQLKDHPPEKKNGPILVMSNLAYAEAKEEAMSSGASDFFVKSDLEPKEVIQIIEKQIGK